MCVVNVQRSVWTDIEALASQREIHALAERIFICGHPHALLIVELRAFKTEALPTQSLTENRKCILKITQKDSMKIFKKGRI